VVQLDRGSVARRDAQLREEAAAEHEAAQQENRDPLALADLQQRRGRPVGARKRPEEGAEHGDSVHRSGQHHDEPDDG